MEIMDIFQSYKGATYESVKIMDTFEHYNGAIYGSVDTF